ncbi:unnamed protein product [Dibothriocephalus latus]|uniref:Uncharacterized protein n=1 Tax=Dibothriocephalus latus TaxID=60516 RepID=A0A3P7L917_DIBLA|nr:unnamed protein product [Dibothriocephalus latus]
MAEVADLYYGIAAPFKAISKHNKKHAQQMQSCFEKAVKRGFVSPSVRRTVPSGNLPQPSPEAPDDPFESELEHHLVGMLGEEQAKRLLSGEEPLVQRHDVVPQQQPQQPDEVGTSRFNLPSGIHYDHEEFLKFLVTPLSELEENRLTEMAKLRPLDKELQSAIQVYCL